MYTMILAAMLSGGAQQTQAWHWPLAACHGSCYGGSVANYGCSGCSGCYGCSGCGGCYGGSASAPVVNEIGVGQSNYAPSTSGQSAPSTSSPPPPNPVTPPAAGTTDKSPPMPPLNMPKGAPSLEVPKEPAAVKKGT